MTEAELQMKTAMQSLYHSAVVSVDDGVEAQLFVQLMDYVGLPTSPSILKASLRTVRKLLENDSFKTGILSKNFDAGKYLKVLYACKIDHDHDQEEVILLLI
jgi:hypothetical protein